MEATGKTRAQCVKAYNDSNRNPDAAFEVLMGNEVENPPIVVKELPSTTQVVTNSQLQDIRQKRLDLLSKK